MPEDKSDKNKVLKNTLKTSEMSKDLKLKEINDIRRNLKRSTSSASGTSSSSSSSSSSNTSSGSSSESTSSSNSSSNISSGGSPSFAHRKKVHSNRAIKKLEARKNDHSKETNIENKSKYSGKPKSQRPVEISNKDKGNIWPDKINQERIRNKVQDKEREKGRGRESGRDKDMYKSRDEMKMKNREKTKDKDKIRKRAEINEKYVDKNEDKEKNSTRNKNKITENEKSKEVEKEKTRDRGIMRENAKEKEGDKNKTRDRVKMKGLAVTNDGAPQNEREKEKERHKDREHERIKVDLGKEQGVSKSKIDLNIIEKTHQIEEDKVPKKSSKIHATKLTRNITSAHLKEIFSTWGTVTCVDLPMDHFHPEFNRGFAYIDYDNPAPIQQAIAAMNCGQLDGQEISVVEVPVPREYERVRRPPRVMESRRHDARSPLRRPRSPARRSSRHSPLHRRYPLRSPPRWRRDSPRHRRRSPVTPVRRNGKDRRSPITRRRSKSLPSRSR